jgi:hypothetical protein
MTSIIEGGKTTGEFKATVNAEQTALTIIALLEGLIVVAKATGKPAYAKSVINSLETIIRNL